MKLKIIAILFVLLGFAGFHFSQTAIADNANVPENTAVAVERFAPIAPEQAKELMQSEDCIVLDVRTLEEYNEGHIPNAVCLPNETITADNPEVARLLPDKDQLILTYCRSGKRSQQADEKLAALGYTNIVNIGGILNWPYEIVK